MRASLIVSVVQVGDEVPLMGPVTAPSLGCGRKNWFGKRELLRGVEGKLKGGAVRAGERWRTESWDNLCHGFTNDFFFSLPLFKSH